MNNIVTTFVTALAVLALAACGPSSRLAASTVTVTPPTVYVTAAADPTPVPGWGSTVPTGQTSPPIATSTSYEPGLYAVGRAQPGVDKVIPAGRYRMVLTEAGQGIGALQRCSDVTCDETIDMKLGVDGGSVAQILPTDVAVMLTEVTLTGPLP